MMLPGGRPLGVTGFFRGVKGSMSSESNIPISLSLQQSAVSDWLKVGRGQTAVSSPLLRGRASSCSLLDTEEMQKRKHAGRRL